MFSVYVELPWIPEIRRITELVGCVQVIEEELIHLFQVLIIPYKNKTEVNISERLRLEEMFLCLQYYHSET